MLSDARNGKTLAPKSDLQSKDSYGSARPVYRVLFSMKSQNEKYTRKTLDVYKQYAASSAEDKSLRAFIASKEYRTARDKDPEVQGNNVKQAVHFALEKAAIATVA